MSLTLSTYAVGDTNYVGKMNADNIAIAAAVNALSGGSGASIGNLLAAMFGGVTALIGAGSYVPTGSGTTLTVAAGYAYLPASSNVVSSLTPTTIDFTGFGAATYYINVDATGNVTASATQGAGTLFSVVWTGSAFGAITRVAPLVAGGSEMNLSLWIAGLPAASEVLFEYLFVDAASFPAALTGSRAIAGTASTGTATFALAKNGSGIGSLVFTASATGVFTFSTAQSFAAGDVLKITAPGSQDATLANISMTLLGTRLG
jgi:hypothetical protein